MSNSTGVQITQENQAEILELVKQAESEAAGGKTPEPQKSEESKQPEGEAKPESKADPVETKADEKQDDKAKGLEIEKKAESDSASTVKFTVDSIAQEFEANNGKLSEETTDKVVKALEAAGFENPSQWLEQFIEGRQIAGDVARQQALAGIGGEDGFKAMSAWAKANVSADDLAAYNAAVKSPDPRMAKLAVDGMYARFQASGAAPKSSSLQSNRIEAGANTNAGGVEPVFTTEQIAAITADPRYDRDPAWRAQADRRIQAGIDAAKRKS